MRKSSYEKLVEEKEVGAGTGDGHDNAADPAAGRPRSASSSSAVSTEDSGGEIGTSADDSLEPSHRNAGMMPIDGDSNPPTGDREDRSFGTGVSNEEIHQTANDFLNAIWFPDNYRELRDELKGLPEKTLKVVAQHVFANNFLVLHEAAKFADLEMAQLLLRHGATRFVDTYTSKYEVERLAKIAGLRASLNIQAGAEPAQLNIEALRERYEHETGQSHERLSEDQVINHFLTQLENLENQGQLRNQSPLTNAVMADFVYGPGMAEEGFPLEQENFELIRNLVHYSKSPVDALCAAIDCNDADMIRFLLNMPKLIEDNQGRVSKVSNPEFTLNSLKVITAINDIKERQVTPLMLASAARNLVIFQLLLEAGAVPAIVGPNGNTVLHEAVLHIDTNPHGEVDDADVRFIDYLFKNQDNFGLGNIPNRAGQTALSIACAQRKVGLIGHLLRNQADIRIGDHLSPLHMAAQYGNSQIVDVLLQAQPAQTAEILSVVIEGRPDPFQIALDEERKQILLVGERPNWDDYDAQAQHDWVGVQRSLLKFAHLQYAVAPNVKDNIFNSQFRNATEAINLIVDVNLRQQFLDQLKRYRDDYQHDIQGQDEKFDQAIDKNIRILGLTNDLRKLADAFSPHGNLLSKAEKEQAIEDFKKCGSSKLYDDNIKTFLGSSDRCCSWCDCRHYCRWGSRCLCYGWSRCSDCDSNSS